MNLPDPFPWYVKDKDRQKGSIFFIIVIILITVLALIFKE